MPVLLNYGGTSGQINEIRQSFANFDEGYVVYAKVELQSNAWAKSHRPTKKLFPDKDLATLGGPEIGSLIVELAPGELPKIIETVQSAENSTKWVEKNGKLKASPSKVRSEVGAVKSIRAYGAADRRRFSVKQAIAWLKDPRTGGSYYVETFVSLHSVGSRASEKTQIRGQRALEAFEAQLFGLQLPLEISGTSNAWANASLYIIKVKETQDGKSDLSTHMELLSFLEDQAVVKSILLPPIVQASNVSGSTAGTPYISAPNADLSYPVVGIVDSGITKFSALAQWCTGAVDFILNENQDVSHGTFIAGLVCGADELNTHQIFSEQKCQFYDLGLHPTAPEAYQAYYPRGFIDFLEQLDEETLQAKEHGVRVFNMSLAVTAPVTDDSYSVFASLLDEIADKHDVIFVLPAGNLDSALARDEWPSDPDAAVEMLLGYRYAGQDRIYQPADSIRSLVVGALNPPDDNNAIFPSRYTRRGPGPSLGAKPDIAHVGGKFAAQSGLFSFMPDGAGVQSCGTSYAAPLAAKTIAVLNHIIEGGASREMLIGLAVHHAQPPQCLTSKKLNTVRKDFVGAGVPRTAAETLLVGDNEITLVFSGVMSQGKELNFQFTWPQSLVGQDGGCSGKVKLTLVYRPEIDRMHGGEFVRTNLDVFLRQEEIDQKSGKASFRGRLKADGVKQYEQELLKHGAKWWPVKRLEDSLDDIGSSSQWRLVIEPLARANCSLPSHGISFAALLTISGTEDQNTVFNEMRQQLQVQGAHISDIRLSNQSRVRG